MGLITKMDYKEKFIKLKRRKNCLVLGHNYQRPEIQDISDYLGDSLGLSLKAKETEADLILFCGVYFMAETAAILNPNKKILIPDLEARCPMAKMLDAKIIKSYRKKYPKASVAVYINTTAATKAEADVVFTSSNAVKICSALDSDKILVGPDLNLALFIQRKLPDKDIIPIPQKSFCYVHKRFSKDDINKNDEKFKHLKFYFEELDEAKFIFGYEKEKHGDVFETEDFKEILNIIEFLQIEPLKQN